MATQTAAELFVRWGGLQRLLIECNAFDIFTRLCYQYSNLEQWSQTKEMRNMLEELVDNILLCLNSLIVEPLKPEVTKARDACLSQFVRSLSHHLISDWLSFQLATLLLSCCAGWGATIAHAVLEEKGENIIGIVFSVISITRAEATVSLISV
ncbi:hypothetical protein TELCIR_15187 [Teladorsagia circumcincta]|uniref:Uncharacterized protein n=1 Tax=Teladorsagia circumcincta TaxID=45464 RepID=A0A2G9TZ32_TELCI|nr:hypothetical protein TELCIR_15187 [Teladorsagia circumcincta]